MAQIKTIKVTYLLDCTHLIKYQCGMYKNSVLSPISICKIVHFEKKNNQEPVFVWCSNTQDMTAFVKIHIIFIRIFD